MGNLLIKSISSKYYQFHQYRTFCIWMFLIAVLLFGCAGGGGDGSTLQLDLDNPIQIVVETNSGGATALVLEGDSGTISRIDLGTLKVTETLITGLRNPVGFAIESSGNSVLVVENTNPGRLVRANLSDKSISVVCPSLNFNSPSGIVLENDGKALVTENGRLSRIDLNALPGGCTDTPVASGLGELVGMALDLVGNSVLVTVSSPVDGKLTRIFLSGGQAGGSQPEVLAMNLKAPSGVAILPTGSDALVVQTGNGSVVKIAIAGPQTPSPSTIVIGLNNPRGIAISSDGNTAFVTETNPGRITPITGFFP